MRSRSNIGRFEKNFGSGRRAEYRSPFPIRGKRERYGTMHKIPKMPKIPKLLTFIIQLLPDACGRGFVLVRLRDNNVAFKLSLTFNFYRKIDGLGSGR